MCDLSNAVGTAGDILIPPQSWLNKVGFVGGLGAAGMCAVAPESLVPCLFAAGFGIYTVANGAVNASGGSWVGEGWNWQDAATGGLAVTIAPLAAEATGTAVALGFGLGFVSDLVDQQMQHLGRFNWNHAGCSGAGGAYAAGAIFSGGELPNC